MPRTLHPAPTTCSRISNGADPDHSSSNRAGAVEIHGAEEAAVEGEGEAMETMAKAIRTDMVVDEEGLAVEGGASTRRPMRLRWWVEMTRHPMTIHRMIRVGKTEADIMPTSRSLETPVEAAAAAGGCKSKAMDGFLLRQTHRKMHE